MTGRIALVTGANQGLGLALVEGLSHRLRADDTVYLTGRDGRRVAAAAARIPARRAAVRTEVLDVSSDVDVRRAAELLAERHGGVDIVFSNAYRRVEPTDPPAEVIADYVGTNNLGTTRVLRAFAPLLRNGGRLLVVASTMGTLHYLAPALHDRFDGLASLADVDDAVCRWRDAVIDGRALAEAWPAFINVPSKIAQVAAIRALARRRRHDDARRGIFVAAACPGMIDTAASRPWFDMNGAQTPAQAAGPLLDLAVGPRPDAELYGELVRFGRRLPWSAEPRTTIPLLPATSLDESLSFWQVLGFEVTMRQKAPNGYAVVRYEDFELHLFELKRLEPENNFTTCLVIVAEVEQLHASFAARLKESLGRAAYRGLPRLSRMRPGQTRFTVTDVVGNSVIFVKRGREDDEAASAYKRPGQTPLQRAVALAERMRDFKNDDAAAALVLDKALERYADNESSDYRRAMEARIELADANDESERAGQLRGLLAARDRRRFSVPPP